VNRKEHKAMEVLMAAVRPLYGLDIVERSDGMLGKGTVYVTLARLEERGFIEAEEVISGGAGGLMPRRLYSITTAGARAYWSAPLPGAKRWWQFWR
jgi:DNA-binding PadR family transcriptional regulator